LIHKGVGRPNALILRGCLGKSDPLINLPTAGPEDLCKDLPGRLQLHKRGWPRESLLAAEKDLPLDEVHLETAQRSLEEAGLRRWRSSSAE